MQKKKKKKKKKEEEEEDFDSHGPQNVGNVSQAVSLHPRVTTATSPLYRWRQLCGGKSS